MTFDLSQMESRLVLIEWEHTQREEITEQLENAFPSLAAAIKAEIDKMPFDDVENADRDEGTLLELAGRLMSSWKEVQSQIAVGRAEQSLLEIAKKLQSSAGISKNLQDVWPALREDGVLGPSMHQLPTLIQFPMLNKDFFRHEPRKNFFRKLWLDVRGRILDRLTDARSRLIVKIETIARQQLFANGMRLSEPCFVNKLQAAILKAADHMLQEPA